MNATDKLTCVVPHRLRQALVCATVVGSLFALAENEPARADDRDGEKSRSIRTFFVTRSLTHERLIPYLETARPEIVQIGNYGAMFHGYAHDERSTGWPMQLPVAGEEEALQFQRRLNERVHDLGLTVVGHFRLVKVMGHWKDQTGFVEYYNNRWPEGLLGEKPHPQVIELLQRDSDGVPIQLDRSGRQQLALCLSSPHARQMFKQMLKVAVDSGVDGVVTTYNYHFGCVCPYCQLAFKKWLREHLAPGELRAKLGIENLDDHTFDALPARIPGYPDPEEATELDWLAMRWGAEHFKRMFDDIFLHYGRSLRRDLLVAQWNHLGHVGLREERMFLPQKLWGRGEDYFWYSGGAAFVGKNLNQSEGKVGDAWLSCLYVRAMGGDKPFVIGKYDRTRMAVSMAEGFAIGGMGMGRYMKFENPIGFDVLARYTNFMHAKRHLYQNAAPRADAALVLPRQSVLNRQPNSLATFRELGQALLERQVLLDVVADQEIARKPLSQYPAVILPRTVSLSDNQVATLERYAADGGLLLVRGESATMDERRRPRKNAGVTGAEKITGARIETAALRIAARLREQGASVIEAPWSVRVAAYTQPSRIVLHLVNYLRQSDAPETNRTGPETERPKAVESISVSLSLPPRRSATSVTLHAPRRDMPLELSFANQDGHVTFTVPRLRVYAVIAVKVNKIRADRQPGRP